MRCSLVRLNPTHRALPCFLRHAPPIALVNPLQLREGRTQPPPANQWREEPGSSVESRKPQSQNCRIAAKLKHKDHHVQVSQISTRDTSCNIPKPVTDGTPPYDLKSCCWRRIDVSQFHQVRSVGACSSDSCLASFLRSRCKLILREVTNHSGRMKVHRLFFAGLAVVLQQPHIRILQSHLIQALT
jgi:hypothetical protein